MHTVKSKNPVRSSDIRESNEKLILSIIRENRSVSQSDVVSRTGLRAPTVLRFFTDLEERGYIRKAKAPEPVVQESEKRGRRPVYYEVVPESVYAIGLEFWLESASVVIEDFSGKVVYSRLEDISQRSGENLPEYLISFVRESIHHAELEDANIIGICVAAPGQVDVETGDIIQYSRKGLADINLRDVFHDELDLPVLIQNNSTAVAWDFYINGPGREHPSLFTLLIRAGVGGSFIDNREVFITKTHTTLEIGHIAVEYNGRACDCGSSGCLEAYISEQAILEDCACIPGIHTIHDFDTLPDAVQKDTVSACLEAKSGMLAMAVRNLISLFGPEMVLIVTRSQTLSEILADQVAIEVRKQSSDRWQGETYIASATYDPLRAGRGASELLFRQFLT
jgi:predicted NBD/HSP70 family sugar kinase